MNGVPALSWYVEGNDKKPGVLRRNTHGYTCSPATVCAGYEQEARYFEEGVRHVKQSELVERAQVLLHGAFLQQLLHLRRSTLQQLNADLLSRDPGHTFAASAAR